MRPFIVIALVLDLLLFFLVVVYELFVSLELNAVSLVFLGVLILFAAFCVVSLRLLRTRRPWVVRTWTVVLSMTFAYWILDLAAGVLLIQSPWLIRDDVVHHRLPRSAVLRVSSREYWTSVTTDRWGLRGDEISLAKDSDQYRIVMLGDSFTMGKGVEDDETFAALLDERLSQTSPLGVEVINAGVDSYTPLLSYLYLRYQLADLDPDLVVLNLDMSDLIQDRAYRALAVRDESGEIVAVPAPPPPDWFPVGPLVQRWTRDHLFLGRMVMYQLGPESARDGGLVEGTVELANPELLAHTLQGDEVDRSGQWGALFESIGMVKAFCDARGMQFLLTVYPWGHQVDDEEWVPGRNVFLPVDARTSDNSVRIIEERADAAGITLLNVIPQFRARRREGPIYFDHDMHWRPVGHRIMADALEPHLRDQILGSVEAR